MTYKFLYRIVFFLFLCQNVNAQISTSDSIFLNAIFQESPYVSYWNKPGTWFENHEVTSVNDMYNQIDSNFIFNNNEFVDCYKNISITSDLLFDTAINTTFNNFEIVNNVVLYGINNPFVKVKFSLNNKTGYTYSVLDSSTQQNQTCKTAFMIISGTGTNMMTDIIKGLGYHNIHCYVEKHLLPFGDVYTMSAPNEDHRAIIFNKKKIGTITPSQPTYLQSYLNAANRSYGVNRLIETVAMIKYLKSKYDKVCVLGLSTGGKVALWSSMMAEPHATLVSAGYSILVDDNLPTQLINTYAYGNFLLDFDKDSTKKRISELKTQFLFTQASNDNALAQLEVDSNLTQNYFQGLTNTSYFYNYNFHAFPPCYVLDSFFTRCMNKATCSISYDKERCRKDSLQIRLEFCGNAPFSFNLIKDSILVNSYTILTNSDTITLYDNGNYQILDVVDGNNRVGYPSDLFYYQKQPQVSSFISPTNYICDSLKTSLMFSNAGIMPWTYFYTKNLIHDSLLIYSDSTLYGFTNGNYYFEKVTDANNCDYLLDDSIQLSYNNLSYYLTTPMYNCDSNKTKIHFDLQGNAPWQIEYTYNGIPLQILSNSNSFDKYFINGTYQFINITDSTLCFKNINQVFTFNYIPFSAIITQQKFDCDSSMYRIYFSLTGNGPWEINYEDGNGNQFFKLVNDTSSSLFLPNGTWVLNSISDQSGCLQQFNLPIYNNYNSLNAYIASQVYDCDSNMLSVDLFLQGNSPWNVQILNTASNVIQTIATNNPNDLIYFPAGIYQFLQITDSTSCSFILNQISANLFSTLNFQKLSSIYNCDSNKVQINYNLSGDAPWIIQYKNLNGGTVYSHITYDPTTSIYLPTGDFEIQSVSDSKCSKILHDTIHINFPILNAGLTPFSVSCDSGKVSTNLTIQSGLKPFRLTYTYDNVLDVLYTSQFNTPIYLEKGLYFFSSIKDSVGCEIIVNNTYQAKYTPFKYKNLHTSYNCLLDSTSIDFSFSGQPELYLTYKKNALSIDTMNVLNQVGYNFSNSTYNFMYLYDSLGCEDSINSLLVINNNPIQVHIDTIEPNCMDKEYAININAKGQAPWNLYYNFENKQDTLLLNANNNSKNLPSGEYYFINAVDATGCNFNMLQSKYLPPFLGYSPILTTNYRQLNLMPNSSLKQYWYKDGVVIDTLSKNKIDLIGDGLYYVIIIDSANCQYQSNSIQIDFPNNINIFPNPANSTTNVLINEDFNNVWKYKVVDILGNVILKGQSYHPLHTFDISYLSDGIYSFLIEYTNAFGSHKVVLRFMKN